MQDNIEYLPFVVIRTPDQMIADAIKLREFDINNDLQTPSHFVRDDSGWKVRYQEDSGVEINTARDDSVIALLRLAEGTVSLNRNPIDLDHKSVSLESFWNASLKDQQTFGALHTSMTYDPLLTIEVMARLEEIFEIPIQERLYTGLHAELIDKPDKTESQIEVELTNTSEETSDPNKSNRKNKKWLVVVTLTGFTLAACGVLSNNSDSSSDTIPLLIEQTNLEIGDSTVTLDTSPEVIDSLITIDETVTSTELPTTTAPVITETVPELVPTTDTVATTIPVLEPITEQLTTPAPVDQTTLPQAPNDGVLTESQCNELGGFQHRFQYGEYLYNALQDIYGIQENQASSLLKKPIIDKYHIREITASTPGQKGAECMPPKSEFINELPAPIFASNSTP